MRMGQGVRTGLGHGVSYRHNFLVFIFYCFYLFIIIFFVCMFVFIYLFIHFGMEITVSEKF